MGDGAKYRSRFADMPSIRRPLGELVFQVVMIVVPLISVPFALWRSVKYGVGWHSIVAFVAMYAAVGFSITVGYHRLIAHRAFKTYPWLKRLLASVGAMSGQGFFFAWIAEHRLHHICTDGPGDPHSPYWYNERPITGWRGFVHAHIGWLLAPRKESLGDLIADLRCDRYLGLVDRLTPLLVLLGILIPGLFVLALEGAMDVALEAALWGGPVRMFFVNHTTWSINSICHTIGVRDFDTSDRSTNNRLLALLALGEGWHNGHHAFPSSARHGLLAGQWDPSFAVIRGLERVGLVWDVWVPDPSHIVGRRVQRQRKDAREAV